MSQAKRDAENKWIAQIEAALAEIERASPEEQFHFWAGYEFHRALRAAPDRKLSPKGLQTLLKADRAQSNFAAIIARATAA